MSPLTPQHKSILGYAREAHPFQFYAILPLFVGIELVSIGSFAFHSFSNIDKLHYSNRILPYLVVYSLTFFLIWIGYMRAQREQAFLERFALINGYTFIAKGVVNEAFGSIFRIDGKQEVLDLVTGNDDGRPVQVFLYKLVIGSGREKRVLTNTVFEIELDAPLPPLLMLHKSLALTNHHELEDAFGTTNTISLEGDFDSSFTLYAHPGTQIEALEVFAPDTMQLMIDAARPFSVEFAGNRIYIYVKGFIADGSEIDEAFALAKKLVSHLNPIAERLSKFSPEVYTPVSLPSGSRTDVARYLRLMIILAVIFFFISASGSFRLLLRGY